MARRQILNRLHEQYNGASPNELLDILVKKAKKPQKSLCGACGKMSTKEILDGLRDKSDRH